MFKKKIMKLLVTTVLLVSFTTHGNETCSVTEEYGEARLKAFSQAMEKVHYSYNTCSDSMHAAYYWKAIAMCRQEGLGQNIGGGCAHLVGNGSYPSEKIDISHCEIFRASPEVEKQYFEELLNKITVQKCKT